MPELRHYDVALPLTKQDECKEAAAILVRKIRADWTDGDLHFQYFTEGLSNKILCCWQNQSDDRVLFRIHGEHTEEFIDRESELKNLKLLGDAGFSSKVYATFNNGLAYEFVPGVCLDVDSILNPSIWNLVVKKLATMHSLFKDRRSDQKPVLFPSIRRFIDLLPDRFDDEELQAKFVARFPTKAELTVQAKQFEQELAILKSPIVFSHNDLLLKNIVYNKEKGCVSFIDYEYAGFNFQAYDIANHFCEFAGADNPDFSRYPDRDFQIPWLTAYLKHSHSLNQLSEPSQQDVERLYVQVNRFAPLPHFLWCIWSIIQAKNSSIDFDFFQYGVDRINESRRMQQKFANLEIVE